MYSTKTVGARKVKEKPALEEVNRFLKLCSALRKSPHLVPKGVYRYQTFEEARQWMERETMKTLKRSLRARHR